MQMKSLAMISAVAMALTACAGVENKAPATPTAGHEHHGHHGHQHGQDAQLPSVANPTADAKFVCRNGMTVKAHYPDTDRVTLSVDTMQQSATLPRAQSASGAYYAGKGFYGNSAEWHEKNGEAIFAFAGSDGSKVETDCRVSRK